MEMSWDFEPQNKKDLQAPEGTHRSGMDAEYQILVA